VDQEDRGNKIKKIIIKKKKNWNAKAKEKDRVEEAKSGEM
jgi:hypothetical protein